MLALEEITTKHTRVPMVVGVLPGWWNGMFTSLTYSVDDMCGPIVSRTNGEFQERATGAKKAP